MIFSYFWFEIISLDLFFGVSLNKVIILQRFRSFFIFQCCDHFIVAFGLSLAYYDIVIFVILLRHFICVETIQTEKQIRSIEVVHVLKNWNRRYSHHYIIKFLGFILIYYHLWFLAICILDLSIYCKFESIKLFFFQKIASYIN